MNWWLIGVGLVVHLVFFYSIFDIYFTSPLVHNMTPHRTALKPPADRLILFVADGLRADKLFELDETENSRAPFIREVVDYSGVWGVSHTRVPTESRPGHVALIAGFYEDVSAVAKGWKENPVEFDSLFNQSRYTWSWGSPDILPMFSKGASGDHVFTKMYPAESEDFAGSHLANLDTWVFNNVKELFNSAKENATLNEMLHQDKIVLFLHLLGLDTNGHAHRPYSQEYLDNIKTVDQGVRELDNLIEEFYDRDGKTAYILTSDHGMTSWGSHGAGHPSETLTPMVAWGAGIRKAQSIEEGPGFDFDGLSKEWQLDHLKRSDIHQADVCPLMAALVGVNFPVNSVGVLPVDYIESSDLFKAESMFTNAKEIAAQFEIKMDMRKQTTLSSFFIPYDPLTPGKLTSKIRNIRKLIQTEQFEEAVFYSQSLIQQALAGLNYYHNYDRFFLGLSITLGFTGWMSYIALIMFQHHTDIVRPAAKIDLLNKPFFSSPKGIRFIFVAIGATVMGLLYLQSLPWMYYVYCVIPVVLWHSVFQRFDIIKAVWHYINDNGLIMQSGLTLVFGAVGLEIIVMSFHRRELLSIGLVGIGIWPLTTALRDSYKKLAYGWLVSCLLLAAFPLMPVVGRDAHYALVIVAGCLMFVVGLTCMLRPETRIFLSNKADADLVQVRILTLLQLGLVAAAVYIVRSTALSIASKKGLPYINQVTSWVILVMAFILPMLSSTKLYTRLLNIALAFLPTYLLLSTSHEALFVIVLCLLLFCWLQIEHRLNTQKGSKLSDLDFVTSDVIGYSPRFLILTDVRIAFYFIFLLILAFFGTGNIASINSFDPASVYCFLTIFSPFTMGALMMWKILIPFLLVTCIFNAIHITVNVPTQSLLLVVMFMSDFMALNFFFQVRDYGSWLEIGTSISHYVIVMSTICFMLILILVSKIFTCISIKLIKHKKQ